MIISHTRRIDSMSFDDISRGSNVFSESNDSSITSTLNDLTPY